MEYSKQHVYFHLTQLCSISSETSIFCAASVGRDDLVPVAKSVLRPEEVSDGSPALRAIYVFPAEFKSEKPTSAPLQSKVGSSNHLNLSAAVYPSLLQLLFFSHRSPPLVPLPSLAHPPQVFPIPISVQRQGTGSGPRLDFHTVPSTERHIRLIRVNKCGGALLSGAPISLAPPGSAHTDGLE